jgi:hypothetical protein
MITRREPHQPRSTRSRKLTDKIVPDKPGIAPSTVTLTPKATQSVSLIDGLHTFTATCPSSGGHLDIPRRGPGRRRDAKQRRADDRVDEPQPGGPEAGQTEPSQPVVPALFLVRPFERVVDEAQRQTVAPVPAGREPGARSRDRRHRPIRP